MPHVRDTFFSAMPLNAWDVSKAFAPQQRRSRERDACFGRYKKTARRARQGVCVRRTFVLSAVLCACILLAASGACRGGSKRPLSSTSFWRGRHFPRYEQRAHVNLHMCHAMTYVRFGVDCQSVAGRAQCLSLFVCTTCTFLRRRTEQRWGLTRG